jgi:hypothetical protein
MSNTKIELNQEYIAEREIVVAQETDEQILNRLKNRFEVFHNVTRSVKQGLLRALIVAGPAGIGKSHGVGSILAKEDLFNTLASRPPRYEVVKGTASSIGLYAKLFEFREPKNVVAFDDCDTVLEEEESLNTLKGALDSNERRFISWNKDSRLLRREGIPDRFEFAGAAIFITNIKFDMVRSKKLRGHLKAIQSRCHYIDLQMDTNREKLIWLRYVTERGMLEKYGFNELEQKEILDFIYDNQNRMQELSCRMVLKVADLKVAFPTDWQNYAELTCMDRILL